MTLSPLILSVLDTFRPEFSLSIWSKVVTLTLGTILARGRRTVTAALRRMGLKDDPNFSKYRQVSIAPCGRHCDSPDAWPSPWSRLLPPGRGLTLALAETLERRWGPKFRKRGHYRDPMASSKERPVAARGRRWIIRALVVSLPWTSPPWALPILSLPSPTPQVSTRLGRRHQTIPDWDAR
jgi:hypothetical protein